MSISHQPESEAPRSQDAFDLRRIGRGPDPFQYTDELRLRNQILCTVMKLYLSPAIVQKLEGISDLKAHFTVQVGGEYSVYRAELYCFEHNGVVDGEDEYTRTDALASLLERLTDRWENWQLNLALAGR